MALSLLVKSHFNGIQSIVISGEIAFKRMLAHQLRTAVAVTCISLGDMISSCPSRRLTGIGAAGKSSTHQESKLPQDTEMISDLATYPSPPLLLGDFSSP